MANEKRSISTEILDMIDWMADEAQTEFEQCLCGWLHLVRVTSRWRAAGRLLQ